METTTTQLEAVADCDLAVREAQTDLYMAVSDARDSGCTWNQIGNALGITGSGAQKRFGS